MLIKILVVDDSATDRLIIQSMLNEYTALTASDGVEAMRILQEHEGINLLILDLNMPNMNGFQVLEALKASEKYRKLRTIILSSNKEINDEIIGLKLGAVDYIRKPIHMDSLKARIDIHVALLNAEHAMEQQLGEQSQTFEMIFEQAPIGISITHIKDEAHPQGVHTRINKRYEQITGRTKEELINMGWEKITHPDDLEEDLKNLKKLHSGEIKMYSMDKRYIKPDGSIVWVHMVVAPLTLSNGEECSHICLVQDITERKEMEKALNESERSKSVLLYHLPGLAYRCKFDRDWTMLYVSNGCYNLTGYPPESLLYNKDLSYNDIISPEYRDLLWNEWLKILPSRKTFKYEYEIITATGEKKWVLETGQGKYNENGEVEALEGIVLDISDRKAMETALKYNNEHDRWTGLYNRYYLVALLENDAKLKKDVKKALVGINLSMVQLITANYGFQYAQNLIKKVAEALSKHSSDRHLLCHALESRFIFYVTDYKDKDELVDFGIRLADTLGALFIIERINGGIGILELDNREEDLNINLLLRRLLIASEKSISMFGKDFDICFYNEELEAIVNRERDIVEALNTIAAHSKTDDEIFLQYQPIINLKTGKIAFFEALARMRTAKIGLVAPLEFIQIAEKTKLIIPIGEIVMEKAFRFVNKLKDLGYGDIGVSINISVIQLLSPDFTNKLFKLMNKLKVNPQNIIIEITESVFASDYESINNKLQLMRDAGLHIAIDDFGTGHSSLAREDGLIVDCMKIDKHFIDKLLYTDHSKAITGDIISLAHKLGHCTIAEGVERESQLLYLKESNCDMIQGFLISRPLSENDAIEFVRSSIIYQEL